MFADQLDGLYRRINELYAKSGLHNSSELLPAAFKELATAAEELQVTIEELQHKNQEILDVYKTLEFERQRYQNIFDLAPQAYLVTDPSGIILEANSAAANLLKIAQKFILGKPLASFILDQQRSSFCSELVALQKSDRQPEYFLSMQPRSGQNLDVALTLKTIRDSVGNLLTLHWLLKDITQRKLHLNSLEINSYDPCIDYPKSFYSTGENIPLNNKFIWLVSQGLVKLTNVFDNGEAVMMGLATPSMVFGSSLTSMSGYQATPISPQVQLVSIPLIDIEQNPTLAQVLIPKITRRLQQTEAFLAVSAQRRVKDRLLQLLELLKQEVGQPVPQGTRLSIRLTHHDLANACCTTRVTMTRLLSDLQQKGLIIFDSKKHIIVFNQHKKSSLDVNKKAG
ncbi:MAG: helix-turn-helix domain-containing protein [Crinalium sp.]